MSVKFLTPIYFSFPARSKPFQNNPSNYFSLQPNILQSFGELGQLLKKKKPFLQSTFEGCYDQGIPSLQNEQSNTFRFIE